MRQPPIARILLVLALVLSGALAVAAQAAPSVAQPAQNTGSMSARVAIVHAAPFAAGIENTTVTVVASALGQNLLLTNSLRFGNVIPYVTVPSGTYTIKVFPGSLTLQQTMFVPAVITKDITVASGKDYTAIAVGRDAPNPSAPAPAFPLDLMLLDDTTDRPASVTSKVRVVHAAPFGNGGPSGTGVDVVTDAGMSIGLNNLTYPNNTGFVTLPSGTEFNLKVVATGTSTTIIDLDPFTLSAGDIATVIAVGGANGYEADVLFVPFVERGTARVRFVHAAPFASGNATVTVALNGPLLTNNVLTDNLNFGEVSFYRTLTPGIYSANVFVGTTATGDPVIEQVPLVLQDGQSYTVVAQGTNTPNFPLGLAVLTDNNMASPSATARLRVGHFAPFLPGMLSEVDLLANDGTALANAISYGEVRSNISLPSGVPIDLKVTRNGQPNSTPVVDLPPITFNAGDAFTVLVIGGANEQPAGYLLLDDRSVTQMLYLPMVAR